MYNLIENEQNQELSFCVYFASLFRQERQSFQFSLVFFVLLDKRSKLPCFFLLKRVQKFAKQAKNVSERARITSSVGK